MPEPESLVYAGSELELFARASNWKDYWSSRLRPYLGVRVLEVGAGIGTNTSYLLHPGVQDWLCLEPDHVMADRIGQQLANQELPSVCRCQAGTVQDLEPSERFDTILYVDVLEHIEQDREELERAARHLLPGGRLIVLSPAHNRLFSPFDQAIGHFRRYDRALLQRCEPATLSRTRIFYLDSVGMLASLAAAYLLRARMPSPGQIWFWDRCMVPASRTLDRWLGFRLGKTIVGIWTR